MSDGIPVDESASVHCPLMREIKGASGSGSGSCGAIGAFSEDVKSITRSLGAASIELRERFGLMRVRKMNIDFS